MGDRPFGRTPALKVAHLDEKHFRRVPVFENKQSSWKEWRTHFLIAVRETSSSLADTLVNAEGEENELTLERLGEQTKLLTPLLYSRLMTLMRDMSFSIVETTDGNGVEAWRLLSRKFNPTTHARCVQMVTEIISHKIHKNEEVLTSLVKWEAKVVALARDHKEVFSEKLKIGFLMKIFPQGLSEKALEELDRPKLQRSSRQDHFFGPSVDKVFYQ